MKIYAMMNVYNECDWMLHHIAHIYPFVDWILIAEGNNSEPTVEIPARSNDGTIELCRYLNERLEKVAFIGHGEAHLTNNKIGQSDTFNKMLGRARELGIQPGDWIFLADPDEIMTEWFFKTLRDILESMPPDKMAIETWGPMFWFSFKTYIMQHRERMWKYVDDAFFRPTVQYHTKQYGNVNSRRNLCWPIGDGSYPSNFHYAFIKPPRRELTRRQWEVSCGYRSPKVLDWFEEVFMKWDFEDRGAAAYIRNKEITGVMGINFSGPPKEIEIWDIDNDGKHPSIVRHHPYRGLGDIRTVKESKVTIESDKIVHHALLTSNHVCLTELHPLIEGFE